MAEGGNVTPLRRQSPATPPGEQAEAVLIHSKKSERRKLFLLYAVFGVQAVSAFFFLGELWTEILGLRHTPVPYEYLEMIQILASLGLVIGVAASAMLVRGRLCKIDELNRQMDIATGNYSSHLQKQFTSWKLSPSEQAVTIYAMKGFSNAEIADYRNTTVATVKSQLNAVYRKSGLTNRQQLISFLVEELLLGIELRPATSGPDVEPAEEPRQSTQGEPRGLVRDRIARASS